MRRRTLCLRRPSQIWTDRHCGCLAPLVDSVAFPGLSKHIALRRADIAQIVRLNAFDSAKELEYFVPRAKRFGNIEQIAYTVGIVAKGVLGVVFHESWRALYREQPRFAMKPAGAT